MNVLKYKGYAGVVEFDAQDNVFHGRVAGILDVITFRGRTVNELVKDFHQAIDEYLDLCRRKGKDPDQPFSGKFVVRLKPELHRQAVIAAQAEGKSLNAWVAEKLAQAARERLPA